MSVLFGRQWETSNGAIGGDVFKTWADSLASLTTAQVKHGLDLMQAEGGEFPPNLIKFLRLCRTVQHASHKPIPKALPRSQTQYSVMRIERAKQKALTGQEFGTERKPEKMVMDWNGDDEAKLCELIASWDESTGHQGLNELIDHHEFSHGRHYTNAGLTNPLTMKLDDGRVRYVDNRQPDWMPQEATG